MCVRGRLQGVAQQLDWLYACTVGLITAAVALVGLLGLLQISFVKYRSGTSTISNSRVSGATPAH